MTRDNNLLGKFNLDGIPPMPRGQPQIDVCFDIDANGILNVSALEKSTGKENKITITNDKGRLSQEEIERMVQEAEKFKAEDDANKNRVEAKNGLENYCYTLKTSISSPEAEGKIPAAKMAKLDGAIDETLAWLDSNLTAEKEEFEEKQKSLEAIALPILQGMGGGGMPDMSGAPTSAPAAEDPADGPTIEEID